MGQVIRVTKKATLQVAACKAMLKVKKMIEQLMKLKFEVECLRKQKKKLKQTANGYNSVKQMYKLLLFWSWCFFVVFYWVCIM